jgi:uncharacterized protein YfaT (DUF1175 family)
LVLLLIALLPTVASMIATRGSTSAAKLTVVCDRDTIPADGYSEVRLTARSSTGGLSGDIVWSLQKDGNLATLDTAAGVVRLRAGTTAGRVIVTAATPGLPRAQQPIILILDPTDEFGDGTPDFLRLQDPNDRAAFRDWFTFLAESSYFQKKEDLPAEVTDCAALLRFCYREALRQHDGSWADRWHLPAMPNMGSVKKYDYPHTTLGAELFRVRPGAFAPEDLKDGTFSEFADAQSLWRYNTHFVSRDLRAARAGDLLFFRQAAHRMPFHAMIYVGDSHFGVGGNWLVYHTGPDGTRSGELRRVTIADLLWHPQASWRPLPQNPAFLGIYRWNILREGD